MFLSVVCVKRLEVFKKDLSIYILALSWDFHEQHTSKWPALEFTKHLALTQKCVYFLFLLVFFIQYFIFTTLLVVKLHLGGVGEEEY